MNFLFSLLTLLLLWASWKELKEQCFTACPEKYAEELCPKCLLVLWMTKHELNLSHRQNNLSWTSGHHVFCTLEFFFSLAVL